MCGIAGLLNDAGVDRPADHSARLLCALTHRGPDGQGLVAQSTDGELCLAHGPSGLDNGKRWRTVLLHRRLSIVDVAGGAQPMSNEDGTVWIVFNGEIYNQADLRTELEGFGHCFRTRADTEVVIHGWEQWGPLVLERLNGIFAFAILDARRDPKVWLARDAVGVKPLFVGHWKGGWWFASELAAARRAGVADEALREEAIPEFLVYRFIPSPGTPYRNVWKVPPGHYCSLEDTGPPRFLRFGPAFRPRRVPQTDTEWEEGLRQGIAAAVARQLMSDVPVGSLLSGGVDSTVVTGLMRGASRGLPQAFAIGLESDGALGELPSARNAARALGVPLVETSVSDSEYLAAWPEQIGRLGEPIANSSTLLVALLCQTVGRTHKVVLCGQGADEPLGGYPRHAAERLAGVNRWLGPIWSHIPERFLSSDRVARLERIAGTVDETRRFTETLAVFGPNEAQGLTRHRVEIDQLTAPVEGWLSRIEATDSLNRFLAVDVRLSLADDLLLVADHMSMASSVELRLPFLDLELLGLIEQMPSRMKVSSIGRRKWLYRRAVRPLLPPAIRGALTGLRAQLGRKLGFTTPLERWFRRWCESDGTEYLLGRKALLPNYLHAAGIQAAVRDMRDVRRSRARQLMSLYVLETWLRRAVAPAPEAAEATG